MKCHAILFALLLTGFVCAPCFAGAAPGEKEGEIIDNAKLIKLIEADLPADVILEKLANAKCDFIHDTDSMINLQNACKKAKWKSEEVTKLHKEVAKLAQLTQ